MSVHKIRLAGPWEWSPAHSLANCGEPQSIPTPPARQTCQLPFRLDKDRDGSQVSLIRRFHCPTGIGEKTNLVIALEVGNAVAQIRLNGEAISRVSLQGLNGQSAADTATNPLQRFEVSSPLRPFNEMNVLLTPIDVAEVAVLVSASLEIHE